MYMHSHSTPAWRPFAKSLSRALAVAAMCLVAGSAQGAESKPALKTLFVTGGGYHDYKKLAPFLTSNVAQIVNVTFDVKFGLEALRDPKFADRYDAVVYDMCDDEVAD